MRERHHASRSALTHLRVRLRDCPWLRLVSVRPPSSVQGPASSLETLQRLQPRLWWALRPRTAPLRIAQRRTQLYRDTGGRTHGHGSDMLPKPTAFRTTPTLTTRHNRPVQQSGPGPAPLRDHDSSSARPVYRRLIGAAPGGQAPRAPDLRHREGGRGGGGAAGTARRTSRLVPVIIIVRLPRSALDKVASRARHLDRLRAVRAAGIGAAALEAAWGGRRLGGRRVRVSAAGPP